MSHEKVKSIQIKDGKVYLTSKANNDDCPVRKWECTSLTEVLQEKGQRVCEIEILKAYESGEFQSTGDNKWNRALRVLRQHPDYPKFSWRLDNTPYGQVSPIREARESEAFNVLLGECLDKKPESGKFLLTKKHYTGDTIYCLRTTSRCIKWISDKAQAKVFKYMEDAERLKGLFTEGQHWNIEAI